MNIKKTVRKAVTFGMTKTWDAQIRWSRRSISATKFAGEMVRAVGTGLVIGAKATEEQLKEIEADPAKHLQQTVDLYTALLTFDKELLTEVYAALMNDAMTKMKKEPPAWFNDLSAPLN